MASARFRLTNKTSAALVRGQYGCNTGYWTTEPAARVEPDGNIAWSADVGEFGDPDGFVNYYIEGQPGEWVLVWVEGDWRERGRKEPGGFGVPCSKARANAATVGSRQS